MNGEMKKTAFLFPGQGSQYVGMAKDIFEEFSSVRELFEKASDILHYDLADACFDGPEDRLKQTAYTQPAIFVHSCALDMVLRENFVRPSCAAGHSLGEYSALVSAGVLDFETALAALATRSAAMQADCDRTPGTMAAVIGMSYEDVVEGVRGSAGTVVAANYNSPDQTVIAGEKRAVEAACSRLKEEGARRAIILPVSGAYHSPLMAGSAETMKEYISGLTFGSFEFPIYSNVSAEPVSDGYLFKKLLSKQILSPVLWYPILRNMHRDEIMKFAEIGPGKALQGMAKRSLDDDKIEIVGVDTLDELDQFMNQYARLGT